MRSQLADRTVPIGGQHDGEPAALIGIGREAPQTNGVGVDHLSMPSIRTGKATLSRFQPQQTRTAKPMRVRMGVS